MEEKHHVKAFHEKLNVLVKENIKKDFLQGLKEKPHKTLKLMTLIPNQHLVKGMGETNLYLHFQHRERLHKERLQIRHVEHVFHVGKWSKDDCNLHEI